MPYRTQISPHATRQVNQWGLPEPIWMEVLIRLGDILPQNPGALLDSLSGIPKGMLYYFILPDPDRPDFLHEFAFRVVYHADEQNLLVLHGSYWRHAGGLPEV